MDRRGATAVLFGVTAGVVVGFAGLATEGGTWYLTQRDSQNAADAAAYAGAMRLGLRTAFTPSMTLAAAQDQARAAARDVGTRNGFTNGVNATNVIVNTPAGGNVNRVEVIIERTRPRLISNLFLATDPLIRTRGVAAILPLFSGGGGACVLALRDSLTFQGSTNVTQEGCVYGSNNTGSNAVQFPNAASSASGEGIFAVGGCYNCEGNPNVDMDVIRVGTLPATNPFEGLDSYSHPQINGGNCINPNTVPRNGTAWGPPAAGSGFCQNLRINNSETVTLNPGTYVFWGNADLVVNGGGTLNCTGCTFIFAGNSQIGMPSFNGGATINITAPTDGPYAGLAIFRQANAAGQPGNGGQDSVTLNGGANISITGGMYFPTSNVTINGNLASNSTCFSVIAYSVTFTGNSTVNGTGCEDTFGEDNSPLATIQVVRLVE